jgi:hypothetical protein
MPGGSHHAPIPARPVELAEEEVLPTRQAELAVDQGDCLGGSDQACLEVRIAVAVLGVMSPHPLRDLLGEEVDDVLLHALVPVLLDHDRRRGALGVDVDDAVADAAARDDGVHFGGDVDQLLAPVRRDVKGAAHGCSGGKNSEGGGRFPGRGRGRESGEGAGGVETGGTGIGLGLGLGRNGGSGNRAGARAWEEREKRGTG